MHPFFGNRANLISMQAIFIKWLNTPFRHAGRSKMGVDCTQLIGICLCEAGILLKVESEKFYSRTWFLHGKEEFVVKSIEANMQYLNDALEAKEIEKDSLLLFGDLLLFATATKLSNHAAFYAGENQIFHAVKNLGVRVDQYDQYKPKLAHVYRLYYKG